MKAHRSKTRPRSSRRGGPEFHARMRAQSTSGFGDISPFRPNRPRRCSGSCRRRDDRRASLLRAADRLQAHLDHSLGAPDTIPSADLAAFVSALALTEIALDRHEQTDSHVQEVPQAEPLPTRPPLAESVVDYPVNEDESRIGDGATEAFLWRRELENLWRTHITKDEFHRPVVRSIGLPVLVIVDHVRSGRSWKSICENYPGLVWDDIRAAVSMATECGWLEQD